MTRIHLTKLPKFAQVQKLLGRFKSFPDNNVSLLCNKRREKKRHKQTRQWKQSECLIFSVLAFCCLNFPGTSVWKIDNWAHCRWKTRKMMDGLMMLIVLVFSHWHSLKWFLPQATKAKCMSTWHDTSVPTLHQGLGFLAVLIIFAFVCCC